MSTTCVDDWTTILIAIPLTLLEMQSILGTLVTMSPHVGLMVIFVYPCLVHVVNLPAESMCLQSQLTLSISSFFRFEDEVLQ